MRGGRCRREGGGRSGHMGKTAMIANWPAKQRGKLRGYTY
jgi:hypothetical protein